MEQPINRIFSEVWSGDIHYTTSIFDSDSMEHADIGYGMTRISSLRSASKRLERLLRDVNKLINKELEK